MIRKPLLMAVVATGFMAASAAQAQDASFGVGVGLVKPENIDSTVWITGNMQFPVANQVVLEPEIGYWKKNRLRDLSIGANLLYKVRGEGADFFVGAGASVQSFKLPRFDSNNELGIHLLAGAEGKVSDELWIFGALRYDIVEDINMFKVYGGVRFGL